MTTQGASQRRTLIASAVCCFNWPDHLDTCLSTKHIWISHWGSFSMKKKMVPGAHVTGLSRPRFPHLQFSPRCAIIILVMKQAEQSSLDPFLHLPSHCLSNLHIPRRNSPCGLMIIQSKWNEFIRQSIALTLRRLGAECSIHRWGSQRAVNTDFTILWKGNGEHFPAFESFHPFIEHPTRKWVTV